MKKLSQDAVIAWVLAILTVAGLLATERAIGFTRDESFYFDAADLYTPWYLGLIPNLLHGRILESFSDAALQRSFWYNWEHPVLMKTLFGLSHWLFADQLHWLRPAAAYRFPAWVLSGALSALIYLMGLRLFKRGDEVDTRARGLSVFAAAAFWLEPRSLYDGHLACFDMPITVAWTFVVYCYMRSFDGPGRKWSILTGVAYGLALCIKLNSFFYPAMFVAHWALLKAKPAFKSGGAVGLAKSLPLAWLAMAVLGPAIFMLHWPYLWPHPVERIGKYLAFHAQHVHYPWYYLHDLLRAPPFPILYVVVVTALSVPLAILALMATGTFAVAGRLWREPENPTRSDWLTVWLNGLFPLLLISWPTVPHFGGTKHWLPGMPFLSLIAADALWRVAQTGQALLAKTKQVTVERLAGGLGAACLLFGFIGCIHVGGYGDSAYNELAGEFAGATQIGMQRQFWSNNVSGVLDWLNHNAPQGARIYFHEVTPRSVQAYKANGMLREDIQTAGGDNDAVMVPYQYMQEFRQQEFDIWNAFGTSEPVYGLYLDESPNVTVYRRPGY